MTAYEARRLAQAFLAEPDNPAVSGPFTPFLAEPARESPLVASPSPALDAEVILSRLLGVSRSTLLAHPELPLAERETDFLRAIARRATGFPVAYLVGVREFWGLPFIVTPAVLIPKEDTETLVERACAIIRARAAGDPGKTIRVLDVCTGSGCVAIALKKEIPALEVAATDISPGALAVARENGERLVGKGAIAFSLGDLRDGLPPTAGGWDLIVSNPPYVPDAVAKALLEDGRSEPLLALAGGADGLDLVKALASEAKKALCPGGIFLVETGEYNAGDAASFLRETGFAGVVVHRDLEGQDRVVEGTAL